MLTSRDERTEFLRYVYDNGGASEATRQAYISTWREASLDAIRDMAKLSAASSNSVSTGYQVAGQNAESKVLELAAWARGFVSYSTIALALAEVPSRVRTYQTKITSLRVIG